MSCIAARSLCFSAVPWTSREHQGADNCKYLASWAGLKVFCMPWVGFHVTLLSCLPAEANQSWDTHTRPLTRLLLHLHGEAATSKAVHERQKKTPSKFRDFIICVNHHRYGIFLWCSQRSKRLGGHAGVQTAFQLQHWSSSRARLRALPSPSHSSPLISTLLLTHYLCICWRKQYQEMLMNSPASLLTSSRLKFTPQIWIIRMFQCACWNLLGVELEAPQ